MRRFWRNSATDRLNDYWNVAWAGTVPDAFASREFSDPALMDTIDRIHGLYHPERLDDLFVSALEQRLMEAFVTTPAGYPAGYANDGRQSTEWTILEPWGESSRQRSKNRPRFVAAGLATLLVIAIAFYSLWPSGESPVIVAPQTTETPAATPDLVSPPAVTMYRGNNERTGEMPGPAPSGVPGVLWHSHTGGQIIGGIYVGNDMVYAGSSDGAINAFDAETGSEIWSVETAPDTAGPYLIVDGNTIYAAGNDGRARALNAATGAVIWESDPALQVSNQIVLGVGLVLVGGVDNYYYGLNPADGTLIWTAELTGSPQSRATVFVNDTLYFGTNDGKIYALDVATGTTNWTWESGMAVVKSLAYANGTIFAPIIDSDASNGAFAAVDAAAGTLKWQIGEPGAVYSAASVFGDSLLIGGIGELLSVSQVDGSTQWVYETGTNTEIPAGPAIVGSTTFFAGLDGNLYAVDLTNGSQLWHVALDGQMNITPAIIESVIYVGTLSGDIYALGEVSAPGQTSGASPVASPMALPATPAGALAASDPAILLWSSNASPDNLRYPGAVTVAPDGTIWVADTGNSRFQIFQSDGTRLETWGTRGSESGEFQLQQTDGDGFGAIVFADDGSFYVLDVGNTRVQEFTADRIFIAMWGDDATLPGALISPIAIDLDAAGNVYVLDESTSEIKVFASTGEYLSTVTIEGVPTNGGTDLAVAPDGTFYLAHTLLENVDGLQLVHVSADCTVLGKIGTDVLTGAFNVEIDDAGFIYVSGWTDQPAGIIISPNGSVLGQFAPPEGDLVPMQQPWGIAPDGQGNVYLVDAMNNVLMKFQLNPPLWPLDTEATPTT